MDEVQKGEGAIHSLPPQISEETGIKLNFCVPVPKAHVVVYPIISVAILALVTPVAIKQSPTQWKANGMAEAQHQHKGFNPFRMLLTI